MKKMIRYFFLFSKRQFKKPIFLFLLLLLPIGTYFFTSLTQTKHTGIPVAIFSVPLTDSTKSSIDNSLSTILTNKLSKKTGLFQFYKCASIEEVYLAVETKKAECGYIFYPDLQTKLDSSQKNNLIDLIVSPSTTMSKFTNEIVFSQLFEEYSLDLLTNFMTTKSKLSNLDPTLLSTQINDLYRIHMSDNSTFHFSYNDASTTYQEQITSIFSLSVKGFISLVIFLSGFCGALTFYNDKEKNVYCNRTRTSILYLQLLDIIIPVFFSSAVGLLCILLSKSNVSFFSELYSILSYSILVILFSMALSCLIPNKLLFVSTIPVFILGSIIFTPIFIDLSLFVPMLKPFGRLFIPYYYLSIP